MIKKIYHGSENIIKEPIFGYGKTYNDYGLGFYCTEEIDMAKEWGVNSDMNGYANIYEIETTPLNILDLNDDKLMIAIDTKEDLFEIADLHTSLKDKMYVNKMYNQLASIYRLIEYFKLDEKTGL